MSHDTVMSSCSETCEQLWDKAARLGETDSPYDSYGDMKEYGECSHLDSEFSIDAIHAVGKFARSYVIADQCASCTQPLGEQGFRFTCPLGSQ